MRYLLCKEEHHSQSARLEYLYDVFKLYFIKKDEDDCFIIYESFPYGTLNDLVFIIGHDKDVYRYVDRHMKDMKEDIIVAITCNYRLLDKFAKLKNVFVPKSKNGIVQKYDGHKWGFDFSITDSELHLYNNRYMDVYKNIEKSMVKIKK